ncbi:MAG: hypothetical protein ACKOB3_00220, partial [Holophagaceae bacterium]
MTSSYEAISSVKYYQLNDANADTFYDDWRLKTVTLAETKGFGDPFTTTTAIPTEAEANASNATDEVKQMFKANREANNLLIMSCSGIALGLVSRAKGNAREALSKLDAKYARKSVGNVMLLLKEFMNCRLETSDSDPEAWFVELDRINLKIERANPTYAKDD